MTTTWSLKTSNVNSKSLLNEITFFLEECIDHMGFDWAQEYHRQSFVDIISDDLDEVAQKNLITQWNVVFDRRNNKVADMNNGKYVVDVYYKQRNCYNTTQLTYTINFVDEATITFSI